MGRISALIKPFLHYVMTYRRLTEFWNLSMLRKRFHYYNSTIMSPVNIQYPNINNLVIGKSLIGKYTSLIVDDGPSRGKINSKIIIGDNTYIGEYNNIRAAGGTISIGNNCLISQHITIVCSNHLISKNQLIVKQPWTLENNFVKIEDDVWIGANSVILPGVTISKGVVVAAGSIVTKDIPEYAIVAGNPAKILKYRI